MPERERLEEIYRGVLESYQSGESLPEIPPSTSRHCSVIVEHQERHKGVLAVTITLLLKKIVSPEQDIRMHQSGMADGFSGRGLDTRVVTPFLRNQHFPYMLSGTGWLTRSLEQPMPYTLDYPGGISPPVVKHAFLSIIDEVQTQSTSAEQTLRHILSGLIDFRERSSNIALAKPINLSVNETVDKIMRHYSIQAQGSSRLPVLAIHAILSILTREVGRYKGCRILPLEYHTSADTRTDLVGDVHIVDSEGILFEGYEIKHDIPIDSNTIQTSFEKFRTTPVNRFYILTTYRHDDYSQFSPDVRRIADTHGCQLIVNGVDKTLIYYLRLIRQTRDFIQEYVSSLETDASVSYQLKSAWNEIAQT